MASHWAGRTNRFPDQLQNGLSPHRTQKLYYATALFTMPERPPIALSPCTTTIELEQREIDTKIAAFKLHTSQQPLFGYFEDTIRKRGKIEAFHLANTATPRRVEMETDLFAGITE
jgi:hypothetical protein